MIGNMPDDEFKHQRGVKKHSRKFGQSPVTGKKALGGWRHENPFLSLDTIQEGLDHETVFEKKFDLQLISISTYAS